MGYRELKVSYIFTDEEYARLEKITEGYNKKGLNTYPERMFESIMCYGAKPEIEERLSFHERWLEIEKPEP